MLLSFQEATSLYKRRNVLISSVLFLHDNATTHKVAITQEKIQQLNWDQSWTSFLQPRFVIKWLSFVCNAKWSIQEAMIFEDEMVKKNCALLASFENGIRKLFIR